MISLIVCISFYILLPLFFLINKKKWIELVRKQSLSLEELKQQKKRVVRGGIFVCLVLCTYIIFRYKHYLSYPTPSSYPFHVVTFVLILLTMFYFPVLYTLFITIPCIKEKEKEEEEEEEEEEEKEVKKLKL